MTPQKFIAKWQDAKLSERSACQQHFLDLCDLLGQAKPAEVDKDGSYYTFERGVSKNDGGKGWADVWLKGKFGWEYKGPHKDLKAAYQQLLKYREALENPPLLVVCDLDRFVIHTNFTGTIKQEYEFDLQGLADAKNLQTLRSVFTNPEALKPGQTPEAITQKIAERFAELSDGMQKRGIPPHDAAHFLMKLMFCMFAEDIELLPKDLFTKTVANAKNDPAKLSKLLKGLFAAMEKGDIFGADEIPWFNGGLFADSAVVELTPAEIKELLGATHADWSNVEPTIFGTLFERTLDPDKRSQIGAHYLMSPVCFTRNLRSGRVDHQPFRLAYPLKRRKRRQELTFRFSGSWPSLQPKVVPDESRPSLIASVYAAPGQDRESRTRQRPSSRPA